MVGKILLSSLLFFSTLVGAAEYRSLEEILVQPTRPDMFAIKSLPSAPTFSSRIPVNGQWAKLHNYDERLAVASWTQLLLRHSPKLIALFENAYPGGRWAFIGRDGAAFADVFEAFYATVGQRDRVIRIGVSKASFDGLTVEHLKSALGGFNYSVDAWAKQPPLLFVDPVSRGNGRQGRTLLAQLYEYLIQTQDAELFELVKKLNMIGLIVSTHGGQFTDIHDPHRYLKDFKKVIDYQRPEGLEALFHHHQFMSVPQDPHLANEAGYTHFIGAWHESFGPFGWSGSHAKAAVGKLYHEDLRLSILWTQQQIWNAVTQPWFQQAVKNEASALGYVFPYEFDPGCETALASGGQR